MNVNSFLNSLIGQIRNLTIFLQTHPLASLGAADLAALAQSQSNLSALISQLAALNPSAYGIVANEGLWNLLLADVVPQYFQSLINAVDQLLVSSGYTGATVNTKVASLEVSGRAIPLHTYTGQFKALLSAASLEEVTLASALQDLIVKIYGPAFQYLVKAEYVLLAQNAFQAFNGGSTLDGIITGASLSFHVFHAAGSVIESSVVNLIPERNEVYIIGPDQEQKVGAPLAKLATSPPKNQDEAFKDFQDIVDALGDSYKQAHQLPDSTTDFCILGNSPPCNQAVYSNGFNSVYAPSNFPVPAPVLILVHNLDGSLNMNGLWASGVFNFLPSN